ncbi:hypothetical protein ROZALSC1DRAFT_28042 [Rozella allomycis CSF55]|uniref:Uncharacterized protein n=1 Tax=Rozella allomycis (strain CSF55) TaxID=988480 RepID=A0A4P9YP66_ROZAC|nr:hypothetical protein ROZALSC1DRAFT_28042 [Rozella allomycis CSF55]
MYQFRFYHSFAKRPPLTAFILQNKDKLRKIVAALPVTMSFTCAVGSLYFTGLYFYPLDPMFKGADYPLMVKKDIIKGTYYRDFNYIYTYFKKAISRLTFKGYDENSQEIIKINIFLAQRMLNTIDVPLTPMLELFEFLSRKTRPGETPENEAIRIYTAILVANRMAGKYIDRGDFLASRKCLSWAMKMILNTPEHLKDHIHVEFDVIKNLKEKAARRSKINRPTSLFIASPVSAEPLTTTRNEKSVKELSLILEKEKENQIEILKTRQSSLLDTLANEKAVIRRLESEIERERQNVRGMKDQNEGEKNRIESVKKNFLKQIDSEREDLKAIITKLQESIEKRTVQVDQMNKISEKLTGREYLFIYLFIAFFCIP